MDTFEGIQHIGEHIFNYLPTQDILNCRLTSKSWKNILDNPIFWLKKLNSEVQHPREIQNKWLTLIRFANQNEVPLSKIAYCLIIKYCKFVIHSREKWISKFRIQPSEPEWPKIQKFMLGLPPIYQALHNKSPDIEVIKLIGKSDVKFTDSVECPRKYKLYYAGFIWPNWIDEKYVTNPLHESIKIGHDLDVIRYLESKTKTSMKTLTEGTPRQLAVTRDNLKVYKFFSEIDPHLDLNKEIIFAVRHVRYGSVEILKHLVSQTENPRQMYRELLMEQQPMLLAIKYNNLKLCQLFCEMALTEVDDMVVFKFGSTPTEYTAIGMAIIYGKVKILEYLVSKSNKPNSMPDGNSKTPLHYLAMFPCLNYSFGKCPCVKMLNIMIPKIINFDVQDQSGNETALHMAIHQYRIRKPDECLKQKIKILAPLTSLNITDKRGMTAIDYAKVDPDICKIFYELNLVNGDFYKN